MLSSAYGVVNGPLDAAANVTACAGSIPTLGKVNTTEGKCSHPVPVNNS